MFATVLPTRAARGSRTGLTTPLAVTGGVLVLAVALIIAGALVGFSLLEAVRAVETDRGRWAAGQKAAVVHLQRYAFQGDPVEFQRYRAALASHRAMRAPLAVALESPGDLGKLRDTFADADRELLDPDPYLRLSRVVGRSATTVRLLEGWASSDETLRRLEAEAIRLAEVVEAEGPGSAGAVQVLARIQALDMSLAGDLAQAALDFRTFTEAAGERIRTGFLFSGVLILLMGVGVLRLIWTRVRQAEEALRESERRFRQLAEGIREVFWLTTPDKGEMLYLSPAYRDIWGQEVSDVLESPRAWLDSVHPEDRARVESWLPVQGMSDLGIQYRIVRPDGGIRWIRDRAFPIRDEDGQVRSVAGVATDVTREKELEEQALRGRAYRSVGRLAGGVAHEFNNLLTAVQAYLEFALEDPGLGSEVTEDLRAALTHTRRGAELTRRLLAFTGRQMQVPSRHSVAEFLRDVEQELRRNLAEGIALEIITEPQLPPAFMDPGQIREALIHLMENADAAMAGSGRVKVRARVWGTDPADGAPPRPGRRRVDGALLSDEERMASVVVEVSDDGPGIPKERLQDLFLPFTIALDDDGGMALGLPAVHGIMRQGGGGIQVETGADGTTIRLFIPAYREEPSRS